jgi:hypothetical protein
VFNLGRKDPLAAALDLAKLTRLLHGEAAPEGAIRREDVHAMAARELAGWERIVA